MAGQEQESSVEVNAQINELYPSQIQLEVYDNHSQNEPESGNYNQNEEEPANNNLEEEGKDSSQRLFESLHDLKQTIIRNA